MFKSSRSAARLPYARRPYDLLLFPANLLSLHVYSGDESLREFVWKEGVSIYAAPGRAGFLSGLPPAFLDVGSAEIFRDDVVAYAGKL